jgi:outer membrane protein
MRNRYLAVMFIAGLTSTLGAQQATPTSTTSSATTGGPTQTITFDDAIRIALKQNTTLEQANNAAALDAATVRQQRLSFLPDLRLTTNTGQNYGRSFSEEEGRIIDQTTQSLTAGLSSSVTLFNGLTNVANLRSARLTQEAGDRNVKRAEQTVAFTVASNFLAIVQQQEQVRVQQENLAAQEAQEKQIQTQVKAGARSISDLYQQQATTAAARAAVVSAERDVELARIALIQTLQLDPRGSYDFVAPAVGDVSGRVPKYDLDSLLSRAFASRTDLTAEQTRVEAASVGTRAAAASRLPTVSLTTNYNASYNSAAAAALGSQLDQNRGGSVSLAVSVPIFDRGATSAAVQQAKIQEENARLALADQRQAVALDVRRAWLTLESTRQQLTVALAQKKAADLAVSTTQARYQVGTSTLLELTQARASQLQANVAVVNARNALAFQDALLPYYTGELDPAKALLAS